MELNILYTITDILVLLGACLFKIETNLFLKLEWNLTFYILLQISDLSCPILKFLKSQ